MATDHIKVGEPLAVAGALLGLLAYPVLVDPWVSLNMQSTLWSVAYSGYFALVCWASIHFRAARQEAAAVAEPVPDESISRCAWIGWLALAAAPSGLLIGTTNLIVMDLGSFPLIWVIPLALYLTTFVLVFNERSWCPQLIRRFWFEVSLVGVFLYFVFPGATQGWAMAFHLGVLFVVSMAAHDQLYQSRAGPGALTAFYLAVAAAGWVGGRPRASWRPRSSTRCTNTPFPSRPPRWHWR